MVESLLGSVKNLQLKVEESEGSIIVANGEGVIDT